MTVVSDCWHRLGLDFADVDPDDLADRAVRIVDFVFRSERLEGNKNERLLKAQLLDRATPDGPGAAGLAMTADGVPKRRTAVPRPPAESGASTRPIQ